MNSKFYININNNNFFSESRNKNPEISLIDMCQEFIKIYGRCIEYSENSENEDLENDEKSENEDTKNSENSENFENKELNNKDSENSENKDSENSKDSKNKEILNLNSLNNQNYPIKKIKGSEIKPPKTSFISLKMEIDTVLMFKLLIVLMIITIVMIIIFLLRIEFKPLLNYKLPNDYSHFTIQPPYNNVKKYSIFNKYNDSGMTTLFNLNKNKDTSKLSKSQEIKQEIIDEVKPVMDSSEKEEFRDKPIKSEYFSSNYEFGI